MAKSKSTEKKIFDAATELFLEKGVDRTSVRDIANKAGINLALMNYYFRSKENLFDSIFSDLLQKNTRKLTIILDSDKPLREKVTEYVGEYINMLSLNPLLVSFFMSILHRSRERITELEAVSNLYSSEKFKKQLLEESEKGNIHHSSPAHFFVDMLSLIAFPFAIQMLIQDRNNMDDDGFQEFISQRKEHIPGLLLGDLCK